MQLTARQAVSLVLITLIWGINWTVMKIGVGTMPPLMFRAACFWTALPLLAAIMYWRGISFAVPAGERALVLHLGIVNIVCWNLLIILSLPLLSSGRAAILGYTMPIFSAIAGALFYRASMEGRHFLGIAAALIGSVLLLWHEMAAFAGQPAGVLLALGAALFWGVGTQMLRHARLSIHIATFTFWSVLLGGVVLTVAALLFETDELRWPGLTGQLTVLFNGVLVLCVAQVAWFSLARGLPPQASTLSVMLIPVVGVFSGVLLLGEQMHWQDALAVLLMLVAMFSVLWPNSQRKTAKPAA